MFHFFAHNLNFFCPLTLIGHNFAAIELWWCVVCNSFESPMTYPFALHLINSFAALLSHIILDKLTLFMFCLSNKGIYLFLPQLKQSKILLALLLSGYSRKNPKWSVEKSWNNFLESQFFSIFQCFQIKCKI